MKAFLLSMWAFVKEIFMFGVDAFMVAASREVAKRFWTRLSGRGGAIAALDEVKTAQKSTSTQASLPFLDEYRD